MINKATVSDLIVVRFCAPYFARAVPILVAMLVSAAIGAVPAFITGKVVDSLIHRDTRAVVTDLGIYLVAVIVGGLLSLYVQAGSTLLRERFARDLRIRMVQGLYGARYESATEMSVGELTNRIDGDITALSALVQSALLPLVSSACVLILTGVAMFLLNWQLALIGVFLALVVAIPTRLMAPRMTELRYELSEARDLLDRRISETLSRPGLALVKTFLMAPHELSRFAQAAQEVVRINYSASLLSGGFGVAASILMALGPAATLGAGSFYVASGSLSVGMLVALLTYQMRLYSPTSALSTTQLQIAGARAIFERVQMLLDLPKETDGTQQLPPGEIRLTNVHVVRDNRAIVSDVSMAIAPGTHLAVVGRSGSGKSTLASLLVRLVECDAGSVCIGGADVREINLAELRSQVRLLAQEAHLFDEPVLYNLQYGANARDVDVRKIARIVLLEDLLAAEDPEKTESRSRLSGGERQRVALARALLHNTHCLILDEALSALDPDSEQRIMRSLRRLFENKTLIVITHRLETVAAFDQIAVMHEGRMVDVGSNRELQIRCPQYRELFADVQAVPAAI